MPSQQDQPSKKNVISQTCVVPCKSTKSQKSNRSEKSTRSRKSGKSAKSDRPKGSKKSGKRKKSKKKSYSKTLSRSTSKEIEIEEEKKKVVNLKLIFKGGVVREIKVENFVATSVPMKQRLSRGSFSRTFDLQDCTPECGNVIADYLEKGTVKSSISYFTLGQVLNMTTVFNMNDLHKKMEEVMMVAAAQSASNLLQAILVADYATVSKETMISLHYLAAWRFLELARLEDFYKIPPNQFLMIFGSCELNVSHELVAVDAALQWLSGQRNLETLAPTVFAMVRSVYLSKTDRNMIIDRTITLKFPEQVTRNIRLLLESRYNNRVCLIPQHINRKLVRCGKADSKERKVEPSLPLSKPKPKPGRQKESKSSKSGRRSERSGKKSRKSEKSEKSRRSSGSKRSEKEKSRKSGRNESKKISKEKTVKKSSGSSSRKLEKTSGKKSGKPSKSKKNEKELSHKESEKNKKTRSKGKH